ncbi:type II secretion system F family protein [uncultured Methanobrevibacter sp.]|uniref:type II secretion system F family protein n=1 Tax=uncultured Methanobrevibacter sp. TaxID=253161 RepID=UPI0026248199
MEKRYYDSEIFNVSPINSPLHFQSQSPESNGDKSNFLSGHKFNFIPKVLALLSKRGIVDLNSFNSILRLILVLAIGFLFIDFLIIAFISFELGIAALVSFFMILVFIFYYPHIKKENKYSSISKELPYALRHLSTELRAGKSLFDSLDSVATSDYGVLSEEFSRVLEEIKYGESTENAFLNLEKRVGSNALSRVIREILASLRVGSNLSNSLNIIAEDVNFDIRMKLKEYSEKLNAFIMIYTFLAILAPVIVLTMLLAASVVIGDLVPGDLVLILYGLFFPMIIIFLAFMIKKLEPKI